MGNKKLWGKYRATVINNVDPMQIGRIQVMVPDLSTTKVTNWAMPCVPVAGKQAGTFLLPQVGSAVWIEFEKGDVDYPIWVGGYWLNAADVPVLANTSVAGDANIVLQSRNQNLFVISDAPGPSGGIMLKSTNGASVIINDTGIYIENGKGASIKMLGPSVDINNGKLNVT